MSLGKGTKLRMYNFKYVYIDKLCIKERGGCVISSGKNTCTFTDEVICSDIH